MLFRIVTLKIPAIPQGDNCAASAADKHGCQPEECVTLARFIVTECPHLTFQGLMTVGRQGHPLEEGPNPDFQVSPPSADVDPVSVVSLSLSPCPDASALLCQCPADTAALQTPGAQYGHDCRLPACCESQWKWGQPSSPEAIGPS